MFGRKPASAEFIVILPQTNGCRTELWLTALLHNHTFHTGVPATPGTGTVLVTPGQQDGGLQPGPNNT